MKESNFDSICDYVRTMNENELYLLRHTMEARERELLAERIRKALLADPAFEAIQAAREKGYTVEIDINADGALEVDLY